MGLGKTVQSIALMAHLAEASMVWTCEIRILIRVCCVDT
jgi:SNF2 family DNA or RNA helicase